MDEYDYYGTDLNLFPFPNISNNWVAVILAFVVALYGLTMARVGLPSYIRNLFSNTIFRILFLSLLLMHNFQRTPHVAIAIALIFVLTLDYLNKQEASESFTIIKKVKKANKLNKARVIQKH